MQKISEFKVFLEQEKAACSANVQALTEDGRQDEANMERIRGNIFDIFLSLSGTAQKRFPDDMKSFLRKQINTIPKSWEASLAMARMHKDCYKVAVEETKFQAMGEISDQFMRIWGDD